MARTPNPYQVDAGPYAGIGEGVSNLAQAFLSANDPAEQARSEALAWRARESRENVIDTQDARSGRRTLGDNLAGWSPDQGLGGVFSAGIGSGALDPEQIGTLGRVLMANMGGSDAQTARSVIGAGGSIGPDDAFSIPDREGVAERNAVNDRKLDSNTMSLNEVLGSQVGSGQLSLGELYQAQHPDRYASAAETRAEMAGGGGAGTGGMGAPGALDATRWATVEEDMNEAVDNLASDLGLEPGQVPPELRTAILEQGMAGVREGAYGSPRQAAGALWQQYGVSPEEVGGFFGIGGDTQLSYQAPGGGAAQPRPAPAQPDTGPDATLQQAADAIARGADPGAVRERLFGMGYTDSELAQAGL